jgi:hypothetical protein
LYVIEKAGHTADHLAKSCRFVEVVVELQLSTVLSGIGIPSHLRVRVIWRSGDWKLPWGGTAFFNTARRIMAQTRVWILALLLAVCMVGCSGSEYRFGNTQTPARELTSITVTPGAQTLTAIGEPSQFVASGNFSVSPATQDLTAQVQWISSDTHVATISSTGLATALSAGVTTITANNSGMVGTATLTVTATSPARTLDSITVIPSQQPVAVIGETSQFIAIGNFTGSPTTQDLTSQVMWVSSDVRVATIDSAGLATAIGSVDGGITTITAIAPPSTGSAATGTAEMTVGSVGTNDLPSLTVYEFGQGTGKVQSYPIGINCIPGNDAGCTGHFVKGTIVTLTAVPIAPYVFGGWSFNCNPPNASLAGGSCNITMGDNGTVGAIFNQAP